MESTAVSAMIVLLCDGQFLEYPFVSQIRLSDMGQKAPADFVAQSQCRLPLILALLSWMNGVHNFYLNTAALEEGCALS